MHSHIHKFTRNMTFVPWTVFLMLPQRKHWQPVSYIKKQSEIADEETQLTGSLVSGGLLTFFPRLSSWNCISWMTNADKPLLVGGSVWTYWNTTNISHYWPLRLEQLTQRWTTNHISLYAKAALKHSRSLQFLLLYGLLPPTSHHTFRCLSTGRLHSSMTISILY
jgi:hypothetical protein